MGEAHGILSIRHNARCLLRPTLEERLMIQAVASPCINVCRMDDDTAFCRGCFRTIEEIVDWSAASNDRRLSILVAVERRRVEHDPAGCASGGEFRGDCER